MERVTRQNVEERVANVNRRMSDRGAVVRYAAEGRNGHIGLDRIVLRDGEWVGVQATVAVGTKREIADFLHAMMVALDDAQLYTDVAS